MDQQARQDEEDVEVALHLQKVEERRRWVARWSGGSRGVSEGVKGLSCILIAVIATFLVIFLYGFY